MSKIIHVTDAFNGGVFEVILELVRSFPDHNHIILYRSHAWDPTSDSSKFLEVNVKMIEWNKGVFKKYIQLRSIINHENPDLVHLHSTFAGVIGRLIPKSHEFSIYSPHAFAFQKLDVPAFYRRVLFKMEQVLQRRTLANVAFWPIEKKLFLRLAPVGKTVYAPIMIEKFFGKSQTESNYISSNDQKNSLRVVSIGRLAPQKDPEFFVKVIENLRRGMCVDAYWYGDGSQFSIDRLVEKGIHKSGWLEPRTIIHEISSHRCVAVFTSQWESGPITLFEALSAGVPVVCRSIDAFTCYGLGDGTNPEQLSQRIVEISSEPNLSLIAIQQQKIMMKNLPKSQTSELRLLYDQDD